MSDAPYLNKVEEASMHPWRAAPGAWRHLHIRVGETDLTVEGQRMLDLLAPGTEPGMLVKISIEVAE